MQVFRASPKYLKYRLAVYWILFPLPWIGLSILTVVGIAEREVVPLIIAGVIGAVLIPILFFAYFAVRIDYDMRYYIVTDRSLRVREGAVIVKEMTLSHANVQNLRVVQGPLLRFFGIWNLKADTAGGGGAAPDGSGGGGHSIQMAGIENAHEVRDLILSHLRTRAGGSGLGDLDDKEDGLGRAQVSEAVVRAGREMLDSAAALRLAAEGRLT